jgi:CBS domain-containing protein
MNVEQLMTRALRTCTPTDTLAQAAAVMWDNDCGVVPVVDNEGRALAMITDRDICMAAYTQGRPLSEIPVSTASSKSLYAVRPNETLRTAEELMRAHKIRRLPVVDDQGHLVGVLSLNDLVRRAGHRTGDLGTNEVTRTLGAICQPNGSSPEEARLS